MTTGQRCLVTGLTATLGMCLACDGKKSGETHTAEVNTRPPVITLRTTDYAFASVDTVAAGWTTIHLVNDGTQPHMGQLIRLDSGMTPGDLLKAYDRAFRTAGPRPESARRLGGPAVAMPRDTSNATVHLTPRDYVWICLFNLPDGTPHVVGHGMAKAFTVTGAASASQAAPKADLVMRLVDYSFALSDSLSPGHQTIRVENTGSESHEVTMLKLVAGKTVDDFQAWSEKGGTAPLENIASVAGGVTSIAPGGEAYFDVDLTRGVYLLLCFVTAPDGRSHIEHGMIQALRIE